MKFFAILSVAAIIFLPCAHPCAARAEEPRFFTEMNDIPLMPGLYELTAETTVFDKPEGRIVESLAVGEGPDSIVNANDIKAFYKAALPQLGWVPAAGEAGAGWTDSYVRGAETLRFRVDSRDKLNILRMQVSPRS